jgi:hypothetical protein
MMMMMTFGGFSSAYPSPMMGGGAAAYGNPQAGFQGQAPLRSGASQFPPPVEGNPYEPKRKKHDNFQLSMPDADWGQVAIGTGTGAVIGAGAGALVGLLDNVAQPPETHYVYELNNAGVKHNLRFEQSPNVAGRIETIHIEPPSGGASPIKATVNYEYPERNIVQQTLKRPENFIPQQVNFKVDNNGTAIEASLQRKGWLRKHYELELNGKKHTYKFENGGFKPTTNGVHLHEACGLPEGSIKTKMPATSSMTKVTVNALESGKWHQNLGGKIGLAAAIGGLAFGGYQTWQTSRENNFKKEALKNGVTLPGFNAQTGYPVTASAQQLQALQARSQQPFNPQPTVLPQQMGLPPANPQSLLTPPTPPNQLGYGG